MSNKPLKNSTALVTGAGGGIGQAIVKRLSSAGASVLVTDVTNEAVQAAIDLAKANGVQVWSIAGDLGELGFCDSLVNHAIEMAGTVDILINNAGIMRRGNILNTSDEDYALSFAINVEAPFRLCRSVISHMKEKGGGKIVNVSSCWGIHPGPNHFVYCATKATLAAMTQCLGRDHAADGVRVNAVCPNEVDTPMLRTGFELRGFDPDTAVNELNQTVPLGRIAQPDEIASVVSFLISDEAKYMCGSLVEVNGGKPVY